LKDGRLASAGRTGPAAGTQPVQEYGLGLELSAVEGHERVGHYGSIPGFAADMGTFPESGLTIVVLTNTDFSTDNPPRDIERTVLGFAARNAV
jgi:CubicO group peptidase (beta-lactamase class C family)